MAVTFIGVDLAWRREPTHARIVVLRGNAEGARLIFCSNGVASLEDAAEVVARHATANTVVAIDAPLIIANRRGRRPCEREVGDRFGRFHVARRTSNLVRHPDPVGARFVELLEWEGFAHDPRLDEAKLRAGRWLFEVYPHPAQVVLFELERISKYKTRRLEEKRSGVRELQRHLRSLLHATPRLEPSAEIEQLLGRDVEPLRGRDIAHYEDSLDALFCSYLALHYWRWGGERNEMVGDLASGYIILPTTPRALPHAAMTACPAERYRLADDRGCCCD